MQTYTVWIAARTFAREVPLEERLFDVGMPIGNLLSQVFANVYLDTLDQFCKRELQIHCYVRYMDDVIILSSSKAQLQEWKVRIASFLETELELQLNNKTCIRPINQGIEFVGYRVWPDKVVLRKKTTLHIKRVLKAKKEAYRVKEISFKQATDTLQSYFRMMKYCDTMHRRRRSWMILSDARRHETNLRGRRDRG